MFHFLYFVSVGFFVTAIGMYVGYKLGWRRCMKYEPRKSMSFMEEENRQIVFNSHALDRHLETLRKAFQQSASAVEMGMHKTNFEKELIMNHLVRKFCDTCETIVQKHRYQIRSGPFTKEQARKFLASTLDSVYIRTTTIADAMEDILQRLYFDIPYSSNRVPVERV